MSLLMPAHPTFKHKENGMLNERELNVIRVALFIVVVLTWGTFLTGCTSAQEKREYRNAQVKVIGTQVDARSKESSSDAAARIALYAAMAEVARSSPDSADAIAVALAVSSVQEESDAPGPIVQLHREQNGALELAKVVAPALIATAGTVAVAGYQASVSKNNSNNAARVAIGDATTDADIMRSVTNMASVGLSRETISVGGDYTEVGSDLDQSVTTSEVTTTTTSATETTTTTTDSNNVYTTPEGNTITLDEIKAAVASGVTVTVILDGEEVEVTECEDGGFTFGGGSCA